MQSLTLEHCAPPLLFVFFPTTGIAPARQQQRCGLFVKYSRFWAFQQGVDSFFLPVTLRRGLRGLRFWTECPIIEPVLISYHYNVLILQEALCSIWITLPTPLWTRRCCNASAKLSGATRQRQRPPSGRHYRKGCYKRGDPQHCPLSGRTACGHHLHLRRKRSQQPCRKGVGSAGRCSRQAHPLYPAGAFICQRQSGGAAKAGVRGGAAGHPAGRHGGPR